MRSNDVAEEIYNQEIGTFPSFIDKDALKHNILFAWSRKPETASSRTRRRKPS